MWDAEKKMKEEEEEEEEKWIGVGGWEKEEGERLKLSNVDSSQDQEIKRNN